MSKKDLISTVTQYAISNKQGFTLNIRTLSTVKAGIVVSYKATQNSFNANDLQSVINHAINHDGVVGGWYNDKDGKYYFDSNKVFSVNDLDEAINFAIANEQIAIFNLNTMQEIRIENQALTPKEYSFSSFAEWMLTTANQVVKHYKGDILIDSYEIVNLRNKCLFNPQRGICQGFSLYWGIRETGTWFYHIEDGKGFTPKELYQGLGAKNVYYITFYYGDSKNEVITVREVDKSTL